MAQITRESLEQAFRIAEAHMQMAFQAVEYSSKPARHHDPRATDIRREMEEALNEIKSLGEKILESPDQAAVLIGAMLAEAETRIRSSEDKENDPRAKDLFLSSGLRNFASALGIKLKTIAIDTTAAQRPSLDKITER